MRLNFVTVRKCNGLGRPIFVLFIIAALQISYIFNERTSLVFGQTFNDTTNNSKKSIDRAPSGFNLTFPKQMHVNIVVGAALKRDKAFQPNPAGVMKNGTVTWTNEDTVTHTVTSGNGIADPNMGKEFDSGLLGKKFSVMFSKTGVYTYFCQVHPTMVGEIIVR
ncbi:MAG: plastocyanin/azurin family copper-binding protein [Candidatus Eiseniibacteriota bacterium]